MHCNGKPLHCDKKIAFWPLLQREKSCQIMLLHFKKIKLEWRDKERVFLENSYKIKTFKPTIRCKLKAQHQINNFR